MARKFNSGRLYKVARTIIIILSVLGIIWFGYLKLNYENRVEEYGRNFTQCNINYFSDHLKREYVCQKQYNEALYFYDNILTYSFCLGFILPIVFFGGAAIYKYIFPVKK